MMELEKEIRLLVLENAIKYNGIARSGPVIGGILSKYPEKRSNLKSISVLVDKVVQEVNSLNIEAQITMFNAIGGKLKEKKRSFYSLPKLENAEKSKVVMRIAPFPSGPLHIGNARTAILNDEYVKKYQGKLLLVIDDTIGSDEKSIHKDAYKLIPEGLKWLGINFNKKIIYKSDRLEIYYKYAEELIKRGKAYICSCPIQKLRENRLNRQTCDHRNYSVEKNLELWEKMFKAKPGSCVLRIKTDMDHKNPAFRDRVLFRISDKYHPRTKRKYRVWPLLDFSWAVDDHLLRITHILRGKELMIESEMEKYIWDIFNWKQLVLIHSGLLNIEGVKISKSKSRQEVEKGLYRGWDDPRTWSIQSLEKRGIQPETIRKFCVEFGLNENEITVPIDRLYSENRKLLDQRANRYFFVDNIKKIAIKGVKNKKVKIPLHPDFPKRGSRIIEATNKFYINENLVKDKMYRFMHLFNFINNAYHSDEYKPELNAKLIHWLPVSNDLIKTEIIMPDGNSIEGYSEKSVERIKENTIIQFERFGFCKLNIKRKRKYVFYFAHK